MTRSTWGSATCASSTKIESFPAPASDRDMEIITYVLEGALAHKDSTGASSVIRVGEVQRAQERESVTANTTRRKPSPSTFCKSGSYPTR